VPPQRRLDDAEAGSLFIAQFTGVMIGSAISSPMIERLGSLRLMAFSYAAMAASVACLGVNSWGIGLLSVLSYGCAIGLTAPAANLLVAEINSERRAAALNILNFVWALGAVAAPTADRLVRARRTFGSAVDRTRGAAVRYCMVDRASPSYGFILRTEST
jgi:fucose permease